ncbi:hypothetical protein ANI_1_812114 [Paecilomyces variotii No. 5]|uniref:Uncharacterized protein n=1 Tax=Byssochlamys spectabilis (strain No. 5 / NBRC 109023) TaxID=1356009 RepID=V5FEQ6_BYSSN|nr:hypothetical protein ANI_1_812114 [Paecilomyces variotii No. 5]
MLVEEDLRFYVRPGQILGNAELILNSFNDFGKLIDLVATNLPIKSPGITPFPCPPSERGHGELSTQFVFDRLVEKASFSNGTSFTAITDGVLQRIDTKEILEVKKRKRVTAVVMQESAEFVTWAKNSRRKTSFLNDHPPIISQDGDEIFVSFVFYSDLYIDYLRLASVENPATKYAAFQTYSPFKLNDKKHMMWFATFVVAVTLAARKRRPINELSLETW